MKRMHTLAIATLTFCQGYAFYPETYVEFFVGPRNDQIQLNLQAQNTLGVTEEAFYHEKNLHIMEAGVRWNWAASGPWIVRASANFGRITSGKNTFSELPTLGSELLVTGDDTGQVYDGALGFGYLYCFACNWGVTPNAGWALHRQQIFTHNTYVDDEPTNYRKVVGLWGGPFVGIDLNYVNGPWRAELGYAAQLYYCRQRISQPQTEEITVGAHTKYNFGNYVHLRGEWRFACRWLVALQAEYLTVNGSRHRKVNPQEILDLFSNAMSTKTSWSSGALTLSLGYCY